MNTAEWAKTYAQWDLPPIVIIPNDKRPQHAGWQRATLEDTLKQIADNPGCNLGLAVPQGVMVLDVDLTGDGPSTLAAYELMHTALPATRSATTRSGGKHYLFLTDADVPNAVKFAPGLDVRAGGKGLIVVEPSIVDGGAYTWDNWGAPLAPCPDWLLDAIRSGSAKPQLEVMPSGNVRVPVGMQDMQMFESCQRMVNARLSHSTVLAAARAFNTESFDPPMADHDVLKKVNSAFTYPTTTPVWDMGFTAASEPPAPPRELLPAISMGDVSSNPSPSHTFVWGNYIPDQCVTLFSAHGGAGKSTIGIMLAAAMATGIPLFGIATTRRKVLYVSLEDVASTVRQRARMAIKQMGISESELSGQFYAVEGCDDPVLFAAEAKGPGGQTPTFDRLAALVKEWNIGMVIVDNASQAYAGSEIDNGQVTAFLTTLAKLAKATGSACLLFAHVAKTKAKGLDAKGDTEAYRGGSNWHNSVRSRIFMSREAEGNLIIEHHKNNYGMTCQPLELQWLKDRMPEVVSQEQKEAEIEITRVKDEHLMHLLVGAIGGCGFNVGIAQTGRGTAHASLKDHLPYVELGLNHGDCVRILNRARLAGLIKIIEIKDNKGNIKRTWRLP